jgi:hypothetical protein
MALTNQGELGGQSTGSDFHSDDLRMGSQDSAWSETMAASIIPVESPWLDPSETTAQSSSEGIDGAIIFQLRPSTSCMV